MSQTVNGSASEGGAESELHAWSWAGNTSKVQEILSDGADPNWQDSIGETAIFGAAGWGHAEVVRVLLEYGARHDVTEKTNGWSVLHWAARSNVATTKVLVDAGADVRARNSAGELPIDVAHGHGKGNVVKYLKTVGPQIASRRDGQKD
ncbi:MAG: ankyrin repeat domain-containing protein [Pseudomonadota bacterium]